ncbi:MAG: winged helix DNA-binding domain-containing protein [Paludibacter sp.]|nr:winged helix DNA-binding domain-containing protein [Paludibacter sp.]
MTHSEISTLRLQNQQIEGSAFHTAQDLVAWMGAMQAQDYAMAKWAVGLRVPGSTDSSIETAYNKGEIIRTHLMRPTWHFVSSDDVYWLLELTAPRIRPLMKSRDKQLELTELIYSKCNGMLEKVLSNNLSLTREELIREFDNIHIQTNENRLSHIMLRAELDGIVCSGPIKNKKLTYALLSGRIPAVKSITRDEALATLADRYFRSHCPATLRDFVWWSGLTTTDARKAIEMIQPNFNSETIGLDTYWIPDTFKHSSGNKPAVHLLPAFDEFLIAYADRGAALATVDNRKTISENGIFRPVIVVNGQVEGLWKRNAVKDLVKIEINPFHLHNPQTTLAIETEAARYGAFLDKRTGLSTLQLPETSL